MSSRHYAQSPDFVDWINNSENVQPPFAHNIGSVIQT